MAYLVKQPHRAPAVTAPVPVDESLPRACVIGAGSSGIAAAKRYGLARLEKGSASAGRGCSTTPTASPPATTASRSTPRARGWPTRTSDAEDFRLRPPRPGPRLLRAVRRPFGFRHTITFDTTVERLRAADGRWDVGSAGWRARDPPYAPRAGRRCRALAPRERRPPPAPPRRDGRRRRGHPRWHRGQPPSARRDVVGAARRVGAARSWAASDRWRSGLAPVVGDRRRLRSAPRAGATSAPAPAAPGAPPRRRDGGAGPERRPAIEGSTATAWVVDGRRAGGLSSGPGSRALSPGGVRGGHACPCGNAPSIPTSRVYRVLSRSARSCLAEAQSAWIAQTLAGDYVPPSDAVVRRRMAAEHARDTRQFYPSPRHTLEVDFDHYLWDLGRERKRGRARASS